MSGDSNEHDKINYTPGSVTYVKDLASVLSSKVDSVNHPKHYTSHPSGVECITVTEHMNFNIGNAVKYLWRADLKNGLEDLEKARWYISREIQRRRI